MNNRAACGVLFTKERASVFGINVDCPRWELGGHESTTCEVKATRSSPGKLIDRFLMIARVANNCTQGPLAIVDGRERRELQPMIDEETRLRRSPPSENELRDRERQIQSKYEDKAFDRQKAALDAEAAADKAMLAEVWAQAQREHAERLERQRLKLEMIQTDNSAFEALDLKIAATKAEGEAEDKALKDELDKLARAIVDLRGRQGYAARRAAPGPVARSL